MLPFLKKTLESGAQGPVESVERSPDDESDYDSLEAAAEDLCSAVHAKDYKGVATALRAAFDILESEPHQEYSEE